jgi:hypothetical protein
MVVSRGLGVAASYGCPVRVMIGLAESLTGENSFIAAA